MYGILFLLGADDSASVHLCTAKVCCFHICKFLRNTLFFCLDINIGLGIFPVGIDSNFGSAHK